MTVGQPARAAYTVDTKSSTLEVAMKRPGLFLALFALSLLIHAAQAAPTADERLVVFEAFMRET